jgi:C4-dicarboxylate-specific signal transduction histidine kinase
LLYLGSRLARSYGVINQTNRALQQANEGLEQRVQQRTRELQEAQSTLVATARQAGMAEIATNVLHNVGNVLNSVNICADRIGHKVRASKSEGLNKAVQMINEHPDDLGEFITRDSRGKLLPGYLNQLADALQGEKQGIVDELDQLTRSVDHIKAIVATQQTYAGVTSILEPIQIAGLIEDALRLQAVSLARNRIGVVKEYDGLPVLQLDKHRLLLILMNLLSNAQHALAQVAGEREIRLDAQLTEAGALRIRVRDNGEGIAPENLTRMFSHGFTTRRDGHGFGLHSCALAAREMDGTLTAESDGPGTGAVMTLQVPVRCADGTREGLRQVSI